MVWNDVSRMMIIIILLVVVHFPTLGTAFVGLPTSTTRTIAITKHWKRQVWENPELSNFSLEKLGTTVVEEGKQQQEKLVEEEESTRQEEDDETSRLLYRPSSPEVADYVVVSTTLPSSKAATTAMSDDELSSTLGNDDDDDENKKNKAVVTSSSRSRFSTPMVKPNNRLDVEDDEDGEDIPSTTQRPTFVLEKKKKTTTQTSSSTPPRQNTTTTTMNGDAFWKEKAKERQDAWQASILRATEKKRLEASQWWNATKSTEFWKKRETSFGKDDKKAVDDDDLDSMTETAQGANVLDRLQFWKKAQKEASDDDVMDTSTTRINGDKDDSSPPLKSTPKYGRTFTTTQEPFVSSYGPNGVDKETLGQYEDWKEQRRVVAEQVNVLPNTNRKNDDSTTPVGTRTASTTTTTTRNPSSVSPQRRRPDPEKFQNPDQTIVVQAIRGEDDGSNTDKKNDSYSADFVSGRAVPRSPTSRVKIPRPFFIESPPDLFFIDIGDAAMIQYEISMIVSSSSSTKIPVNQGVAGASAVSTTTTSHTATTTPSSCNNWESGPYEYQVTSYGDDDDDEDHHQEPTSWLGRLVDTLRRDRIIQSSNNANVRNSGEDDYREFTVRRMPAERSSRDGRYYRRAAAVAKRRGRMTPLSAPPPNAAAYYYQYNARSRSRIRRRMGGSSSGGVTLMGEDTLSNRLPRPPNYVERLPPQQHNYYGSTVPPSNQPAWQRLEDDFELPRRSQQAPRGPRGRRPPPPPSDYYYNPPRF